MTQLSDYLENAWLDHVVGNATFAVPTLYIGLSTAATADDGSKTEPSGNGYARIALPGSSMGAASAGANSNTAVVSFAAASGSWGTCTHLFIADALTGGNVLFHGALTASVSPVASDVVRFAVGALDFTADLQSTYLENELLDHTFGKGSWTAPTTLYVALSTAATDDDGAITEPSGNGYARASFDDTSMAAASGGTVASNAAISFPQASGSWGTCSHYSIRDAAAAGNQLWNGQLVANITPINGTTPEIASGNLSLSYL